MDDTQEKEIKLVCISDTHTFHDKLVIPECDILISAGDISGRGTESEIRSFIYWLNKQEQAKHKIFIAGNHDKWLQKNDPSYICSPSVHYLRDSTIELEGLKFYGTPWTAFFFDWSFNGIEEKPGQGFSYLGGPGKCTPDADHPLLSEIYSKIPIDTDILICHGPPSLSFISTNLEGIDCGSHTLKDRLNEILYTSKNKMILGIYGHIHEGRGALLHSTMLNLNVANVDRKYTKIRQPVIVTIKMNRLDNGHIIPTVSPGNIIFGQ